MIKLLRWTYHKFHIVKMSKYKRLVLTVVTLAAVLLPFCLAESDEQYCKLGEPNSSVPCNKPCREYNAAEVPMNQFTNPFYMATTPVKSRDGWKLKKTYDLNNKWHSMCHTYFFPFWNTVLRLFEVKSKFCLTARIGSKRYFFPIDFEVNCKLGLKSVIKKEKNVLRGDGGRKSAKTVSLITWMTLQIKYLRF